MAGYQMSVTFEFIRDLSRLPSPVSKKAARTAERVMENPWAPELHPEVVQRAEKGVHSSRVDDNYRLIWKHIKPDYIVLCLVDKHDDAYRRAQRKAFALEGDIVKVADILDVGAKLPKEQVLFDWLQPRKVEPGALFVGYLDTELLNMGVPQEALPNVRALDDADQLPQVERLLPEDAYNRLLAVALGIIERPVVADADLRKSMERHQGGDEIYLFVNSEEFKRALAGDMEEWMLFLAPHQRQLVTRAYSGPARVKGVTGSGKTVVAVHRARYLAQQMKAEKSVLFLTFGNRLPKVIQHLLERLAGAGAPELDAVECCTVHQWCARFLRQHGRYPQVKDDELKTAIRLGINAGKQAFPNLTTLWQRPPSFFSDEIKYAIKGRVIGNLEQYLKLERTGRGTALGDTERRAAWVLYETYQAYLREKGLWDYEDFMLVALDLIRGGATFAPYRAAVVDEIQDLSEATMRLVRALVPPGPNDLFLVGDGLQRLYPGGYTLNRLGVDITGRGTVLRRNYRNTQEILRAAYAMMSGISFSDLDEQAAQVEEPEYSARTGPMPVLHGAKTPQDELEWVAGRIEELGRDGSFQDRDFAILYRMRPPYLDLIQRCLRDRFPLVEVTDDPATYFGPGVKLSTLDSAKGLEFKVVFIVGATDGRFIPRDDWSLDGPEVEDYLMRERSRLFVAMTRARDRLYMSYSRGQPSRFLADIPQGYLIRE